ncbi:MAG: hypothetical protein HQK49_20900 [Oligoflexia bacterium]|nr:hypothetical protein [Oligoflexia bacterium]
MAEIKKDIVIKSNDVSDVNEKKEKVKLNFRKLILHKQNNQNNQNNQSSSETENDNKGETIDSVHKEIAEKGDDFFKKVPLGQLYRLYHLAILGQLGYAGYDYYQAVEPYWTYGAQESVATYGGFLAVMYVLAMKFYLVGIKKCKKLLHLVILIITPTVFVELANETYLDECKNLDSFNKWYAYNYQGVAAYFAGNYKLSFKLLKLSIEGLDVESAPEKKHLYNKSLVYMSQIESMSGNVQKTIERFSKLNDDYEKEPSIERAIIAKELASGYNKVKQFDKSIKFVELCLKIAKEKKFNIQDIYYSCLYEKLVYSFVRYDEVEPQEVMEMYNKIYAYYEQLINKKVRVKELFNKLMALLNAFVMRNQIDVALEGYLNILNMVRDTNMPNEKKLLYTKISDLYYKKGKKLEGDIYKQKSE